LLRFESKKLANNVTDSIWT